MSEVQDVELLERARRGDENAFARLFARYERAIYRYAAYTCGREAADDVVQDTFLAIAIGTLALGIGANTAMFTVLYTIFLRPLPYRDSGRLVYIVSRTSGTESAGRGNGSGALAPLDPTQFVTFRARTRTLSHVAALGVTSETLTGRGDPTPLGGAQVSPDTFDMLGCSWPGMRRGSARSPCGWPWARAAVGCSASC